MTSDVRQVFDTRRYRHRITGVLYRVLVQARSPDGPVTLRSENESGPDIHTTNDRLAADFVFERAES